MPLSRIMYEGMLNCGCQVEIYEGWDEGCAGDCHPGQTVPDGGRITRPCPTHSAAEMERILADTPPAVTSQATAHEETVAALLPVFMARTAWAEAPARRVVEALVAAMPMRCDFDCDGCRE